MQKLLVIITASIAGCCFGMAGPVNKINLLGSATTKYDAGGFSENTELYISVTGVVVVCWNYMTLPDGSLAVPMSPQDSPRLHAIPGSQKYPTDFGGDGMNHFQGGGLNYVPGHGDISWPVGGKQTTDTTDPATIRFGALIGTFSDSPQREDWFCIGLGTKVTVPDGGRHLYLLVNDSSYADNSGGYWVNIENGRSASISRVANTSPSLASPVYATSPKSVVLPKDNAFGFALPSEIHLTHQIEASTDLANWTPATNLIFYFKDLDSVKFSSRFYRFLETK